MNINNDTELAPEWALAYALWMIASHPDASDEPLSKWMANTAREILRNRGMDGMEVLK